MVDDGAWNSITSIPFVQHPPDFVCDAFDEVECRTLIQHVELLKKTEVY
jgi:hypothetical protein